MARPYKYCLWAPIAALITISIASAQVKKFSYSGRQSPGSSYWYKDWYQSMLLKSNLTDLTQAKEAFHLRVILNEIQMVDIWTGDFKIFNGQIVNWAITANKTPEKFYSEIVPIGTYQAKLIYQLYNNKKIAKIPTDTKVAGWDLGDDGAEYLVECLTPSEYSFKEYWTPSYFRHLREAVTIDDFVKKLKSMLHLGELWKKFIDGLPSASYHGGGLWVTMPRSKQ